MKKLQLLLQNFARESNLLLMSLLIARQGRSQDAGGFPPPAPLNLQYWWPEVPWFGQTMVFEADYDELKLQKYSYDVITTFLATPGLRA